MRIPLTPFFAVAAVMAWFVLPGCSKVAEKLEHDPDAIGQFCRIDTFGFDEPTAVAHQVFITYNFRGDPETMMSSKPVSGEAFDNIFFRYDKSERLVDCFFAFPDLQPTTSFPIGTIDLWHRFTYPSPHLIIDSFFNYDGPGIPPVANPPTGYVNLIVTRYELDKDGRTIRTEYEFHSSVDSFGYSFNTSYDHRGNAVAGGVIYDNTVNPYRTSKVWQLLFQNYSMNNPILPATAFRPATTFILSFDKWGLPLQYFDNSEGDLGVSLFFYDNLQNLEIGYSCDRKSAKSIPD